MAERFSIVGLGEALFDMLPGGAVLGGAPLNVALHAHQLAAPRGGRGVVASRVGQDELGEQIAAELRSRGMTTQYLQTDPDKATGQVIVSFDDAGRPQYDIARDAAWDWIQYDFDLEDLAERCNAICFGTLAQREGQSRNTIYRVLTAGAKAIRLFDVNLRQKHYDRAILQRSLELSTALKLNDEELPIVARLLGVAAPTGVGDTDGQDRAASALLKKFNLKMVALTRGARGTVIFAGASRHEGQPVSYPAVPEADAVGAGDACAAGLLVGMVMRMPWDRTLALANHAGAFVAARPGATPALPAEILAMAG